MYEIFEAIAQVCWQFICKPFSFFITSLAILLET